MFIADPPRLRDRVLDFSVVQTGSTFFAPSMATLAAIADAGTRGSTGGD
ncbi:hypothetical protein [Microbacterium hominis]|nr:hypothetical protein [Microbacterium hominis]